MPKSSRSGRKSAANTTGVMDFLRHILPSETLRDLYTDEQRGRFVCRAVLQQLNGVSQQIVVRLQCTAGQFPLAGVQVWTSLPPSQLNAVLKELYEWAIVTELVNVNAAKGVTLTLTPEFQKGMAESMTHLDASPWAPLQPGQLKVLEDEANEKPKVVTPEDLERYTAKQWDNVMHFLVGSSGHEEPPAAVIHFLLQTNLMQPDPDYKGNEADAPLVITEKGYDFMLQDNHQQVWHFVVQYLKSLEKQKKSENLIREALLLLVSLSFCRVGEAYLASALNKDSRLMVKHLALFGLLYTRKIGKATIFFPTRIALQLVGTETTSAQASALWSLSSKALSTALANPNPRGSSHLGIVVQTNFQVCAYTTSELHVSMLGLFCDLDTIRRLPNIVFLHMTRDSVKSAFHLGIQARQILRFLEKHAHPKLREAGNLTNLGSAVQSPIPANVVDQVWLWDRERTRVSLQEVYQHQCLMDGEFRAVVQYAKDKGSHAWSSERRQTVLVAYQQAERIQNFVRQWRAKKAARQQAEN